MGGDLGLTFVSGLLLLIPYQIVNKITDNMFKKHSRNATTHFRWFKRSHNKFIHYNHRNNFGGLKRKSTYSTYKGSHKKSFVNWMFNLFWTVLYLGIVWGIYWGSEKSTAVTLGDVIIAFILIALFLFGIKKFREW